MTLLGYSLQIGRAPAPPPLIAALQGIEIETSIEEASVMRLRFGTARTAIGDYGILDLDPFRPRLPVGVRVQHGLLPPQAVINGYVTDQNVSAGDEPGASSLEVTCMDVTHLMNVVEQARPWPNMPDSAIAAAIFAQFPPLIPRVDPTSPVLTDPEGTTMQRGTDIRFLRRLARRNGFDCYVQPEPLSGIDVGHFHKRELLGVPQAVLSANMGEQSNVHGLSIRYAAAQPTTAVAADVDMLTKAPQPAVAPVSTDVPLGVEGAGMRQVPPAITRPADVGLPRTADLQRATQALVDRSTWSIVASGTAGLEVSVLRPGGIVNIRGVGRAHSGTYYVTKVSHSIGPCRYEQRFEATRNAVSMTGAELFVEVA